MTTCSEELAEDTCPIGSSITFPRNPRKYYGEQIAREIEARIVERGENEPWDKDINVGLKEAASIARGE